MINVMCVNFVERIITLNVRLCVYPFISRIMFLSAQNYTRICDP